MRFLADIWTNFWSLFPVDVQQAYHRNSGAFLVTSALLVVAFLALPLLAWPRRGTVIAGRYRARHRGRQVGLVVLGLVLVALSPFATTFLVRLVGR
jgi:hypothetical protein